MNMIVVIVKYVQNLQKAECNCNKCDNVKLLRYVRNRTCTENILYVPLQRKVWLKGKFRDLKYQLIYSLVQQDEKS